MGGRRTAPKHYFTMLPILATDASLPRSMLAYEAGPTRAARISTSNNQPSTTKSATCTKVRTGFIGFSSVPKNCR